MTHNFKTLLFFCWLLFAFKSSSSTEEQLAFLQGKFDPTTHPHFAELNSKQSVRPGNFLQREVIVAFEQLRQAALKEGITLWVLSATRNFEKQKSIWEAKYTGRQLSDNKNLALLYPNPAERVLAILRYSAMPGTSRHHWGTDIDLAFKRQQLATMLVNASWEQGEGLKAYQWLEKNASQFGFCQPYKDPPQKRREGFQYGYEVEKWHWSYRPLALQYTKQWELQANLVVSGFAGDSFAAPYARQYVLNIHKDCL